MGGYRVAITYCFRSMAVCETGRMGVVGHPIERPSWRLTFGGPLDVDQIKRCPSRQSRSNS